MAGVQVYESELPFEEALARLRSVIAERGLHEFAVIDHAAAAAAAGLALRRTTVVVFGSPTAGTPLMVASPLLALELPLRVLVVEGDDGRTRLAHLTGAALVELVGLEGQGLQPLDAPAAVVAALRPPPVLTPTP
jgi:uncharacterized protein (DUF302 family)